MVSGDRVPRLFKVNNKRFVYLDNKLVGINSPFNDGKIKRILKKYYKRRRPNKAKRGKKLRAKVEVIRQELESAGLPFRYSYVPERSSKDYPTIVNNLKTEYKKDMDDAEGKLAKALELNDKKHMINSFIKSKELLIEVANLNKELTHTKQKSLEVNQRLEKLVKEAQAKAKTEVKKKDLVDTANTLNDVERAKLALQKEEMEKIMTKVGTNEDEELPATDVDPEAEVKKAEIKANKSIAKVHDAYAEKIKEKEMEKDRLAADVVIANSENLNLKIKEALTKAERDATHNQQAGKQRKNVFRGELGKKLFGNNPGGTSRSLTQYLDAARAKGIWNDSDILKYPDQASIMEYLKQNVDKPVKEKAKDAPEDNYVYDRVISNDNEAVANTDNVAESKQEEQPKILKTDKTVKLPIDPADLQINKQESKTDPNQKFDWSKYLINFSDGSLMNDYENSDLTVGAGDNPDPTGLSNIQIEKIMFPYVKTGFLGVFALDELDQALAKIDKNRKEVAFIMNKYPIKVHYGHWCGVYISLSNTPENPYSICYFDPLGNEPPKEFMEFCSKLVNKIKPVVYLKLKVNTIKWQMASSNCGWHSIRWVMDMFADKPFKVATGYSDVRKQEKITNKFKNQHEFMLV